MRSNIYSSVIIFDIVDNQDAVFLQPHLDSLKLGFEMKRTLSIRAFSTLATVYVEFISDDKQKVGIKKKNRTHESPKKLIALSFKRPPFLFIGFNPICKYICFDV